VLPIAYPLDEFYLQAGLSLPAIRQLTGEEVPEPYRLLLVHHRDMTPTLEQFFHSNIHLDVLRREEREGFYYREVALQLDGSNKPVEFGAIKISLMLFAPAVRQLILEEKLPLGHILNDRAVSHSSRPKAYLRIESDEFINRALGLSGEHVLYGRRNSLFDAQQRSLAEIVEILPPLPNGNGANG
jgi:hypothetical protein